MSESKVFRVEVSLKPGVRDAVGEDVRRRILEDLGMKVESVRVVDVYDVAGALSPDEADVARRELFTDHIIQESSCNGGLEKNCDWIAEVGFRPGVTDRVGKTAQEGVEDILQRPLGDGGGVYTSKQYLFRGSLRREEVDRICRDLLANSLIERWQVWTPEEYTTTRKRTIPVVKEESGGVVNTYDLEVSDGALMEISSKNVLALSLEEMHTIRDYFRQENVRKERAKVGLGPQPTDVELECIAQTWSEHCKHKIFNAIIKFHDGERSLTIDSLFKTYIRATTEEIGQRVDWLLSVFHDNAGVIKLNDYWNLVMKVETHNSPSALDPYGGAITGIVGVNRDPLGTGKGCRLLFNVDTFCFAPPDYSKPLPPRLLHPKRIARGVHRGVRDGANFSGIPDVNGSIVFDERYAGKPLVFCGTGGIMPAKICGEPSHVKKADLGDAIVMTGGRIGKDGIHGATFSSEELHEGSPATAVQIGDPITQKKMLDFLLEARDLGLYRCITDNGAGGLSSSVGEMARFAGGAELHIEKAPLKYAGLNPWEIFLSESQERMTLALPPDKVDAFLDLARRRSVEATVLGRYTHSGFLHVLHNGRTVAFLSLDFLHDGLPRMRLRARWDAPRHPEPDFADKDDLTKDLTRILSRLNACSKEYFVRQYDHEVQGGSALKPFVGVDNDGPGDAAIVRPLLDSNEGVIVASGICPKYSDIDTYQMAACAIDEAVRNAICVGGRLGEIAGLDNFCWPDPVESEKTPDGQYKLAQLIRACQGLRDCCLAYDLPCISGKDSMKNDYHIGSSKISVPPTLLFSVMGRMRDVREAVSMDAKRAGDLVYVVGTTKNEMGGSEFYAEKGFVGNSVPRVDAATARRIYENLAEAMELGLVASCHDCSDGGLGVALAETAFAGGFGMNLDLRKAPLEGVDRNDVLLFSESQSRFVVTVSPECQARFEDVMSSLPCAFIGYVTADETFQAVSLNGKRVVMASIRDLKEAWQKPLRW